MKKIEINGHEYEILENVKNLISHDNGNTIKTILKKIKEGYAIGIFPEGTRVKGEGFGEAKAGLALFAVKGKASAAFTAAALIYIKIRALTGFSLICPLHAITGLSCPGCCNTRMVIALTQFDFKAAFEYNQLSFILLPVFMIFFVFMCNNS